MRKKCVRWAKPVLAFVIVAAALMSARGNESLSAQSSDPSALPRLEFSDLQYVGGFRLPRQSSNGQSFSFGGRSMAYNPATNALYVGSRSGHVAEINIPIPVNSADVNAMPYAQFLQPFADPTEGRLSQVASDGVAIDGLLVYNNRLYGTASIYYDANNQQRVSHYSRSLRLGEPSFQGWSQVWETAKTGFVAGLMALVPAAWQSRLGGPAVTGQCCIPIITRTSWGPAAFAFNPSQVGQSVVSASPLLYYTGEHPTLGHWNASGPSFGSTTSIAGLAIIEGTRTALYFGRNGMGPNCYGEGTGNASLHGTIAADGATLCYDPADSSKGTHAYPYRYQIWAYDLRDFEAVRSGTKQPWEVVPYAVWPFALPTPEAAVRLGSLAYDPARQMIYLSQMYADRDGYEYRAVIHTLKANVTATGTVTPPPSPAGPTSAITLTTNIAAPQNVGTAVRVTAAPTGGAAPHQYKWWTFDGSAWTPAGDWTTAAEFNWTPTVANPESRVGVWVRSAGNSSDTAETTTSVLFPITSAAPAAPAGPATAVALAANKVAPQPAATGITWTATPAGGSAPHQYKWWVYDGATWTMTANWSTSNTYAWTPTAANAEYRVGVWVRSAGNNNDAMEASTSTPFPISATAPVVIAPPPAPAGPVSAVTIAANMTAPQAAGSAISWTATATSGVAPLQYKWWTFDGQTWTVAGSWTASNTFAWTPAIANASYRIGVWVKSAGNGADDFEASTSEPFAVTAAPVSNAPISGVVIGSNMTAPQATGTSIVWTAGIAGTTAPVVYKWWTFDGATWTPAGTWTSSNTFTWTPATANPAYRIGVWAKRTSLSGDEPEATTSQPFSISTAVASGPVSAVSLVANRVAPQSPGTTVVWTATPTAGVAPHQYRWWVYDGEVWTPIGTWTTTNTFAWTPTTVNPNYRIGVWVRSAGNTVDAAEKPVSEGFPIK